MHAGHHDVEFGQQVFVLVESAVLEDVHLDAGQDPERGHLLVQGAHHVELIPQPLGIEPVRHRQAGAVVGQDQIAVTEVSGRLGHVRDRAPAVRPVRV